MDYDEFGFFEENAREAGLPWAGPPTVRREFVEVGPKQRVSALVWGEGPPRTVLLHGGAQNAHTWDTVALALGHPLIAVDLPGHGHSDWREDRDYWPVRNADAVAIAIERLAPQAGSVVGMSLGGLTAIRLAAQHPSLVRRLVVVDVTPGVTREKAAPIAAFVNGPETFGSLDELLARTARFHPGRSVSSLRRGVMHNARRAPDGTWQWRYDRLRPPGDRFGFEGLWDDLAKVRAPTMLVLGSLSGVVSPDDITEFTRRRSQARIETVEGAGHSIQGDKPVELAHLIEDFA
ncbi:alpha/beta hydrolase [Actinomadura vinacea]|uniref:Alpha/beta hydrolase n=1 Tax=Actinomadura vinacea TaxID=115336 RepID=A0ABN3JS27_9ACTN